MSTETKEEIKLITQIRDPKTEELIEIDDYMKQESLYLDEEKFPFKIDHKKCLNCQDKDRVEHSCLCFSCQWHLSGVGNDLKRHLKGKAALRDIEFIINDIVTPSIYFDETKVDEAINQIDFAIKTETQEDHRDLLVIQIMRLKQLSRLGLNWESGY